jgi:hypothetical protein
MKNKNTPEFHPIIWSINYADSILIQITVECYQSVLLFSEIGGVFDMMLCDRAVDLV